MIRAALTLLIVAIVGCGDGRPPARIAATDTPRGVFTDAPDPRAPATVWAVGDGADGSADAKALARRIAIDGPDRFLYLGDVYESGTAREYNRNYTPVYGRLDHRTSPTPGNHEWSQRGEGYDAYWEQPPPWYGFQIGGWEVLSLNSQAPHDAGSLQHRWLVRLLARDKRTTCRIAFFHRPRFSAGIRHGDQRDMAPIWDALVGHATIALSGHEHDNQRLRPRDGLTQYVAGAGGKERYLINPADRRIAYADDDQFAALRIRLQPGRATLAFITADGRVLDRSTQRCR